MSIFTERTLGVLELHRPFRAPEFLGMLVPEGKTVDRRKFKKLLRKWKAKQCGKSLNQCAKR